MSLLHRNIVAAAFQEMLKKFEPIALDTAEVVLSVVAPKVAPIATAAIEAVEAVAGAQTSDTIAAGVAAASAPPAAPAAPPAAPVNATPVVPVNVSADKNTAALAAVDALGLQMANLATQLAAIRSNLT